MRQLKSQNETVDSRPEFDAQLQALSNKVRQETGSTWGRCTSARVQRCRSCWAAMT
jgi:hypothetical protein